MILLVLTYLTAALILSPGSIYKKQGTSCQNGAGKQKKQPSATVCLPFPVPADLTSPSAWGKPMPSHSSAPRSNASAVYYQLIYCKDPLGLANTECKVTINVNY